MNGELIIIWIYIYFQSLNAVTGANGRKDANGNDGIGNVGRGNTGDGNIGNYNDGNGNIGDANAGNGNIGDANWGNKNIGNFAGNPQHLFGGLSSYTSENHNENYGKYAGHQFRSIHTAEKHNANGNIGHGNLGSGNIGNGNFGNGKVGNNS